MAALRTNRPLSRLAHHSYSRGIRTRPEAGRHASKQWKEKQERLKKEREERRKKRQEEAKAKGEAGEGEGEEGDGDGDRDSDGDGEEGDGDRKGEGDVDEDEGKEDGEGEARQQAERPANIGQQNIIIRLGRMLLRGGWMGGGIVPLNPANTLSLTSFPSIFPAGADGCDNVKPLPRARVPVVKFAHKEIAMACDVCINNLLATRNTRLLSAYAHLDVRVVQLALVVKFWAKRRNINSTYQGTLSSYAYVLLVIFFLQTRPIPVIPSLQQIRRPDSDRWCWGGTWLCTECACVYSCTHPCQPHCSFPRPYHQRLEYILLRGH